MPPTKRPARKRGKHPTRSDMLRLMKHSSKVALLSQDSKNGLWSVEISYTVLLKTWEQYDRLCAALDVKL